MISSLINLVLCSTIYTVSYCLLWSAWLKIADVYALPRKKPKLISHRNSDSDDISLEEQHAEIVKDLSERTSQDRLNNQGHENLHPLCLGLGAVLLYGNIELQTIWVSIAFVRPLVEFCLPSNLSSKISSIFYRIVSYGLNDNNNNNDNKSSSKSTDIIRRSSAQLPAEDQLKVNKREMTAASGRMLIIILMYIMLWSDGIIYYVLGLFHENKNNTVESERKPNEFMVMRMVMPGIVYGLCVDMICKRITCLYLWFVALKTREYDTAIVCQKLKNTFMFRFMLTFHFVLSVGIHFFVLPLLIIDDEILPVLNTSDSSPLPPNLFVLIVMFMSYFYFKKEILDIRTKYQRLIRFELLG